MPSGPRICADRGDLLFLTNAEVHCGASRTPPLEPRRLRGRAYRWTVPGGAPDGPRGCARRRNPGPQPPRSVPGPGPGRPPPLPHLCARHGVRQRHPEGPGPHRLLPGSRPDSAPGSPGHSLRLGHTGHRLSVLPLLQSVHVPARRCVPRKHEAGPSPRERRLGESSVADTARLHRLLLGGLQSPRPQEELEMRSSRRDPRGAGRVTGATCCSARRGHRRRPAPGSGLAAAAGTPGGPGPDPRDRTPSAPQCRPRLLPVAAARCGAEGDGLPFGEGDLGAAACGGGGTCG